MGWIRSYWLDALIFLLFAIIMAGVVMYLLGVNPFARPPGGQVPPSSISQPAPQAEPQTPPPMPQPQQPTPPATPQPRPQTPPTARPGAQPEPETVVTVLPIPQAPTVTPPLAKPVPAPPRLEDRQPQPAQPETARPAPRPERPVLTADAGGSWRIAVGSFGNRENAQRLATTLRQQGYPVGLEASGSFTRVWIGPYSSQTRARAIANTLSQYQPQVARVAASAPPAPQTQPPAEAPTSTGSFLQVGAFRNMQSAQSVVQTVQQAGYPVVLIEEGGLVKVRVGPLDNTTAAEAALRAKGLEVLVMR